MIFLGVTFEASKKEKKKKKKQVARGKKFAFFMTRVELFMSTTKQAWPISSH